MAPIASSRGTHFVYLLRCGDRTYYVGYTTDPARRLAAHRRGLGARYTRGRGPFRLVAVWRVPTVGAALRLEHRLKRLPRAIKHRLARGALSERFAAFVARADDGRPGSRPAARTRRRPRRTR